MIHLTVYGRRCWRCKSETRLLRWVEVPTWGNGRMSAYECMPALRCGATTTRPEGER